MDASNQVLVLNQMKKPFLIEFFVFTRGKLQGWRSQRSTATIFVKTSSTDSESVLRVSEISFLNCFFMTTSFTNTTRYNFSPNKRTREQMKTLWVGLTGGGEEGRKAISDNFRPTMDTLVEDTSSKFWRARVGACGALSQICVGRSWADLGGGPAVLDENYDLVVSKTSSDLSSSVSKPSIH